MTEKHMSTDGVDVLVGAQPVARMVALDDGLGTVILEFIGERPPAGTVLYAAGVPGTFNELPEGRNSQHVLKAEGASSDATDRENCANASPDGGPMGVGQAAAAAPAGVTPCAHRLADARNAAIQSGYVCVDCHAVFAAADHGVAPSHPPLAQGFDGSTVRPGSNHSTIEIWYDTEEQARAAHKVIRDLIDASGVKEAPVPQPVAWLHYDANAIEGEFPWVLMVNRDHPLIQAKTDRVVLFAAGVKEGGSWLIR